MEQGTESELDFQTGYRSGRPMKPGQPVWKNKNEPWKENEQTDVNAFTEEMTVRFHLGYCRNCGSKVVAGYNTMGEIMNVLEKRHFPRKRRSSIRSRLGKLLLKGATE